MSNLENKIICSKKDLLLTIDRNTKIYNLNFNTISSNFNFQKYSNFNIYKLLYLLNKDLVESIDIINQNSDNEADILIIFKEIGDMIKIPKNYIYITVNKLSNNNGIIFESVNNNNTSEIINKIKNCTKTTCECSILKIKNNNNILNIDYTFKFNIDFQKSIYIDNIISLLIKKVFYKLKVFIENPSINNYDLQSIS